MQREELLKIVEELKGVLIEKNVSLSDAKSVTNMLVRDVEETIEKRKQEYEKNGKFY